MKNKILLAIIIFPTLLLGQGIFPFKYRIIQEPEPDRITVSYMEKNTNAEDSILLVVVDSCAKCNFHSLAIICPDTAFHADLFNTDSIMIKYYPDFKIRLEVVRPDGYQNIKDTGKTCRISQLTVVVGRHSVCNRTIYSKIPLSRKKIRSIKEYVYDKGPEPMCIKRKNCWIGLPEI